VNQSHRDGRVVREMVRRRCTCAVHESVRRHDVSDLALNRLDVHVVDVNQSHHDVHDLVAHHRDGRVVRELERRRCTCEVRELDDRLHSDHELHEYLLVFRHPCAVAYRKDSKHHCCA
jgi:hypothetical protein